MLNQTKVMLGVLLLGLLSAHVVADEQIDWLMLDNGKIQVGLDPDRGACIGWLALAEDGKNWLNHYDTGRFIQQSYYGDADGSDWNGRPWVYNPVQGGSWDDTPAEVVSLIQRPESLYAKIIPRHWAKPDQLCPEASMELWVTLRGFTVDVRMRMMYTGPNHKEAKHQELPAVFVDASLDTLVFYEGEAPWTGDALTRIEPGWPNEYGASTEHWLSYVNPDNFGVGVFSPGVSEFTCYRYLPENAADTSAACSYFAPIRTFALETGSVVDYHMFLTLGPLDQIRARFDEARQAMPEPNLFP